MKRKIAAALPLLLSSAAFAQNSVTLYGLIDEGLGFTNNSSGNKAWQMQSGWVAGSRWGLKGSEDLGGGLKAIFRRPRPRWKGIWTTKLCWLAV
jgi:predicted porin